MRRIREGRDRDEPLTELTWTLYRGRKADVPLEQTPDEKAASIINAVPTSSLWTKTGGVVLGTAVTAAAVSTELYVRTFALHGFYVRFMRDNFGERLFAFAESGVPLTGRGGGCSG